jgi:hypothetical protein
MLSFADINIGFTVANTLEKLAKNILNKTGLHYQGMPVQYKIVVK